MEILILKGLPASGKTTWAKEKLKEGGWKRVNKDDLRAMLDNGEWSGKNEKFIVKMEDHLIYQALVNGYNVIVDDTNLNSKHLVRITELAKKFSDTFDREVEVSTTGFYPTIEECIERDKLRTGRHQVGKAVIRRMANEQS